MGGVRDHVQVQVKALQEPHRHRGDEDDGEGPLQKVLGLFPQQLGHIFQPGQAIVGQLHDKGDGLAPEQGLFVEQGGQNAHKNAQNVQPRHDEPAPAGEEGADEEGIDGQLGGAAHKGGEEDGHLPVPFAGEGAGGHHRRNGAAKADEHGHDALAGQADLPQQLVHDKGHPGDIAAVLHHGQEEEQGDDDGQKAEHAAHAGEDAVDDQAVDGRIHMDGGEPGVRRRGQSVDARRQQILEPGAHHVEGEIEHQDHDAQKAGDGGVFSGEHLVNAFAAQPLPALTGLDHRLFAQALDEFKAHIGDGGAAVQAPLGLHLLDDVLQQLQLVLVQVQLL